MKWYSPLLLLEDIYCWTKSTCEISHTRLLIEKDIQPCISFSEGNSENTASIIYLQSNNRTTYTNTYSVPWTWHHKNYDLFLLLKMHHWIFMKYFENLTSVDVFIYTEVVDLLGLPGVLISLRKLLMLQCLIRTLNALPLGLTGGIKM